MVAMTSVLSALRTRRSARCIVCGERAVHEQQLLRLPDSDAYAHRSCLNRRRSLERTSARAHRQLHEVSELLAAQLGTRR